MQHLSGGDAACGGPVLFDNIDCHRLPAPCVVDDQFGIDTKRLVQPLLHGGVEGSPRHIAQREQAHTLQLGGDAVTDAPKIRQRPVRPQQLSEFHLIQLCDSHAVPVRPGPLCHDVHGDLGEEQIGADARRRRDARVVEHVAHHGHGHLVRRHAIGAQVIRHVDEHFVDGIHDDILRRNIFEVGGVDAAAVFLVEPHARGRDDIGDLQRRILRKGFGVKGSGGELMLMGRRIALDRAGTNARAQPLPIDRTDALNDLEQTRTPGHAVCLERRGDGQTDRLLRPAFVSHDEMGGQRVQLPFHTFHARIEALGVNGDVLPHLFRHACRPPFSINERIDPASGSNLP